MSSKKKTTKKTKRNSTKKFYYDFYFSTGNYSRVSHTLEDEFTDTFQGSGFSFDGDFDCSFYCTVKEKQKISKFIKKKWPKCKFTTQKFSEITTTGSIDSWSVCSCCGHRNKNV